MPDLSIKNAPAEIVAALKQRAARNHRSLQGELMAIVTAAVEEKEPISLSALREIVRGTAAGTPSESVEIIRAARDTR